MPLNFCHNVLALFPGGWIHGREIWTCFHLPLIPTTFSLLQFSRSVVSDSLWHHGLQHTRLPCPLPTPGACSKMRVFSNESVLCIKWPNYWSFSFSISPSNEYSGLTGLISLQLKGLWRVFPSTTVQKHQFFSTQPSSWSKYHIRTWLLEKS